MTMRSLSHTHSNTQLHGTSSAPVSPAAADLARRRSARNSEAAASGALWAPKESEGAPREHRTGRSASPCSCFCGPTVEGPHGTIKKESKNGPPLRTPLEEVSTSRRSVWFWLVAWSWAPRRPRTLGQVASGFGTERCGARARRTAHMPAASQSKSDMYLAAHTTNCHRM